MRVSSAALRKFTCVEHEECERSAVVLVVVARRAPPLSPSVPTLRTADRLKSPAMSRAPPRRVKSPPLRNQQQPQQQQMYAAVPQGPQSPQHQSQYSRSVYSPPPVSAKRSSGKSNASNVLRKPAPPGPEETAQRVQTGAIGAGYGPYAVR